MMTATITTAATETIPPRWYEPGEPLLNTVERHLTATGVAPSSWGRMAVGDAGYVTALRKGRRPTQRSHLRALISIGLATDALVAEAGHSRRDLRFYPAIIASAALGEWKARVSAPSRDCANDIATAALLMASLSQPVQAGAPSMRFAASVDQANV